MTRLYNTISIHFYHQSLKNRIETFIQSCDTCQHKKSKGIGYGHLPPQDALIAPWFKVAVDLIGPCKVTIGTREFLFPTISMH